MNLQDVKKLIRINPDQFYVYLLKRPDGIPFYVGKGSRNSFRIGAHIKESSLDYFCNRHKKNTIKKILKEGGKIDYQIVLFTYDELTALDKEIELISFYGRKIHGGTLTNLTDGGEGMSGYVASDETKRKISESGKGRPGTMTGKFHTEETKKKMSESHIGQPPTNKGVPHTEEHKMKISQKLKGRVSNRKGAIISEEQKQKISKSLKGRIVSSETRKRLSLASTLYWARKNERRIKCQHHPAL